MNKNNNLSKERNNKKRDRDEFEKELEKSMREGNF